MYPILAVVPPLSPLLFSVLAALSLALGLGFTARNLSRSARLPAHSEGAVESSQASAPASAAAPESPFSPLLIGAFVVALGAVWSHNPIKLHSYGLLLIVGFVAAAWNASAEARRRGYDPNIVLDLALPLLLVCIAACRILYVVLNRSQFSSPSQWVRIWDGGLSFHGALVGAVAVIAFYGWKHKMGFWKLADVIAPSVFLGYAFGRVGCLLNGCCYGEPCSLPWAVVFPVEGGPSGAFTPPSHPAQLYSTIAALILFAWMQRAKKQARWNRFPGELTLLFFALYAIERFVIEIFRRGVTARTVLGTNWLTEAQLMSIMGLAFVGAFWVLRSSHSSRFERSEQVLSAE